MSKPEDFHFACSVEEVGRNLAMQAERGFELVAVLRTGADGGDRELFFRRAARQPTIIDRAFEKL